MRQVLLLMVLSLFLGSVVGCGGAPAPIGPVDEKKVQEKMRHEFNKERSNK